MMEYYVKDEIYYAIVAKKNSHSPTNFKEFMVIFAAETMVPYACIL